MKRILLHAMLTATLASSAVAAPAQQPANSPKETAGDGMAMGEGGGESLQTLATKAMNPVAKMISVPFQNNFNFGVGPESVMQYVLDIQPVVPLTLNKDWNLITRTVIPVISMDSPGPGIPSAKGLGDINLTLFLSPNAGHDLFWGIGPTFTFPSGTSSQLTSGQWSLGPAAVVMWTPRPDSIPRFADDLRPSRQSGSFLRLGAEWVIRMQAKRRLRSM